MNIRAASYAALGICLLYSALTTKKWKEGTQNDPSPALHYAWIAAFFLLMTVETNDLYRFKELNAGEPEKALLGFVRLLMFSLVWMTYSVVLVGIGLWKKIMPMVLSGLICAMIGMLFGTIKGIAFEPIAQFSSIVNIRFLSLVLLTAGLTVHAGMLRRSEALVEWKNDIVGIVQVAIVLVLFVLLTGETRDYFQKEIVELDRRTVDASRLVNLQQLFLSGVWLAYSVALMSVGLWRRFRGMRFAAMSLFGITILKIFIYDLSFLETLYRIFSFMGLGIILLSVSYVYQKFKDIILGKE